MVRLPGHVLPALSKATALSPSDHAAQSEADKPLTLTIVLKRDHQAAFERYLHGLYDPHAKNFHKFLTQRQIANRFGPSRQLYDRTVRYMRANGFNLVEESANRLTITVRGTRARAEGLFRVHIQDYRSKDKSFFANDSDPAMPGDLAAHVQTIAGLSDLATPRPEIDAIKNAIGPTICGLAALSCVEITATSRNNVYNKCVTDIKNMAAGSFDGLVKLVNLQCANQGAVAVAVPGGELRSAAIPAAVPPFDGSGQKVGLVEFDTFQTSDVSDFLSLIGAPSTQINQLSEVKVDGGATAGPDQDEVLLDIDTVMTIATGADVVVYDAPFNGRGSFQALFNKMISDGVSVISNSWAYCEDQTTLADVEGLDTIFQTAEAGDITIFNGSGDSGSACLDGSANTVSVPADSPNATAVGGSSLTTGPGFTYQSETWWNGSADTPPSGQGGFGMSKFFGVPTYQTGLATGGRSVPDVVFEADPAAGVMICQASNGGCPSGLLYGGTSFAAPQWAAIVAVLNEGLGTNLGALNPMLYAQPDAFHDAASMGSDFSHVGLGSPNIDASFLALSGKTAGVADATASTVTPYVPIDSPYVVEGPSGVFADGTIAGNVVVQLLDANGNGVVGKTVSLGATDGSPTITPPSVVTDASGFASFALTDSTVETPTLTASDTTDDLKLSTTPTLPFVGAPAASASIHAAPPSVNNNGTSTATITVTLKDSLGRPAPGKLVNISQTGNSVISGPNPQVTDADGNIEFTATDLAEETRYLHRGGRDRRQLAGSGLCRRRLHRQSEQYLRQRPSARRARLCRYALRHRVFGPAHYDRRRRRHQFRLPGSGRYRVRQFGESVRQRVHHRKHLQVPARRRCRGTQHEAQQHLARADAGGSGLRFERQFVRQPGPDLRAAPPPAR